MKTTLDFIPLAKPHITEDEVSLVTEVIQSGQLSLGKKLVDFETEFARYVGTRFAVAVSSGTAGLHLCVKALGLREGDEAITSPFSFIASSNSLIYERVKPVFVDIDEETFNIDPHLIEPAITPKTRAILPVHIFGVSADIGAINWIAKDRKLKVFEDGCESLGAAYEGKKVGTFGNPAVFAFYANKQMTTGEGGMVTTDDPEIARKIRQFSNQGRSDNGQWLVHDEVGYNYRMDEMSAALGIVQIRKLDWMLKERARIAGRYTQNLKGHPKIKVMQETFQNPGLRRSWYVYAVRLAPDIDRNDIIRRLQEKGVASKPYMPALHLQPVYRKLFGFREGMFPVCERVSNSSLALPFFVEMTEEMVDQVCSALEDSIKGQ
ncbi:MAG: DegT/DnrJ/EryC1/StrS family aminotransferase [Elusimicrobia bacterium]|nr:DegT/DnrJ/EryC1/StrS family aminotransferase [Elusimicrobiota bacterium]